MFGHGAPPEIPYPANGNKGTRGFQCNLVATNSRSLGTQSIVIIYIYFKIKHNFEALTNCNVLRKIVELPL